MEKWADTNKKFLSLPTRECGLKLIWQSCFVSSTPVAPHAGARIEIIIQVPEYVPFPVAPHAGVWIEMRNGKLVTLWGQRGDLLTEV